MDRDRGYWWSPDGDALLVTRVDEAPVPRWWIADPAQPSTPPSEVAYPAAGTANASVTAWIVGLDGSLTEVPWDAEAWPYLVGAGWDAHGPMIALQPRDQRALDVRAIAPATGASGSIHQGTDPVWVERLPGTPARLDDGRLVMGRDGERGRRLIVGGEAVTPDDLNVRAALHVGEAEVLISANPLEDATVVDVWRWSQDRLERITDGVGVHTAAAGGDTVVLRSTSLDRDGVRTASSEARRVGTECVTTFRSGWCPQ